jgi:hypothetical protein
VSPRQVATLSATVVLLFAASLCGLGLFALLRDPPPADEPEQTVDVRTEAPPDKKPVPTAASADQKEGGIAKKDKGPSKTAPAPKPPREDRSPLEVRLGPTRLFPLHEGDLQQEMRPRLPPRDAPAQPADQKNRLARLDTSSEEELRNQLVSAPEVGLGLSARAVLTAYVAHIRDHLQFEADPRLIDATPLVQTRPDLRCLPLNHGYRCRLQLGAAATLETLSRKLRVYLSSVGVTQGADGARGPALLREVLNKEMRGKRPEWLRPEAIPTMMQMLMSEDTAVRQILVDMLARIPGPQATAALAQRAVFDLDAGVRRSAVEALKDRPAGDCRPIFLRALRYPWAPAADHAAEALIVLDDKAAVADLVVLLKQPNPALPVVLNRQYALVRDVVRTNHLNNCLLCHPPAATTNEPVLGLDPVLTIPSTPTVSGAVNRLRTTPGSHGYGSGGRNSQVPLLIRGDITFLRQDFSVRQPVAVQGFLPLAVRTVRFDYVVRTRYVPAKTAQELLDAAGDKTYPQREAVLHTLRGLTRKDAGPTTEGWLRMFPAAEQDAEAARLSRELRQSSSLRAEVMINRLRETKGVVNTMALATAIPGLTSKLREKAREALVERLTRMTAKTLRDKLRDDDPEVRRAAVQACQRKEKKELVPELIALLEDSDSLTARTAEAALVDLTGQEHRTPVDWRQWWQKQ